jgi:hypothetical protein
MKNLPDHELFNKLEKRLRDYTEDPGDDLWDNIAGQIPSQEPVWVRGVSYTSAVISLLALLWLGFSFDGKQRLSHATSEQEAKKLQGRNDGAVPESKDRVKQFTESAASLSGKSLDNAPAQNVNLNNKKIQLSSSNGTRTTRDLVITSERHQEIAASQLMAGSNEDATDQKPQTIDTPEQSELTSKNDSVEVVVKAETKKKSEEKKSRLRREPISFYVSLTPQLAYHKITPNQNDDIIIRQFDPKPIISTKRFGLSAEAGVVWRISDRFEGYGGLSVYQQSQQLTYQYQSDASVSAEQQNDFDYVITPGVSEKSIQYNMLNVGAQAGLLYYLSGDKLKHKIGAGLSFQQGFKKATGDDAYSNDKSSYLFYQVCYRNEYAIGERLKFFVQPTYMHALYEKEQLNAPFKLRPHRAGISFGIIYSLIPRRKHV